MSTADAVLDRVQEAPETVAPEELMQRLLAFEPVGMPVVSLYLDARVDQNGRHQFLTFARQQLAFGGLATGIADGTRGATCNGDGMMPQQLEAAQRDQRD